MIPCTLEPSCRNSASSANATGSPRSSRYAIAPAQVPSNRYASSRNRGRVVAGSRTADKPVARIKPLPRNSKMNLPASPAASVR